jgi:hypothetical protein
MERTFCTECSNWFLVVMPRFLLVILVSGIVLMGCSQPSPTPDAAATVVVETDTETDEQARVLPTLYPTSTSFPTPLPTDTRPPQPTSPTSTPVNFEQVVVNLRYAIPAIGLERTINGDIAGRLKLTDEVIDFEVERRNQAGVLLELQQSLPELSLGELPEECDLCVWLEYELPLSGDKDEGWLLDDRMLVSLENYTSTGLGPHFPPGTIIGLRRSSSPHHDAHTVALTGDGRLWLWGATDAELPEAVFLEEDDQLLSIDLDEIEVLEIAPLYAAACPDEVGVETLFIQSGDAERYIDIVCPELALPTELLPLYLSLDAKTAVLRDEYTPEDYSPSVAVETILLYQDQEGRSLTVFHDGRIFVSDGSNIVVSDTITMSLAVSMTDSLLNSGLMQPSISGYLEDGEWNHLIVRGTGGLNELAWDDDVNPLLEAIVNRLDRLIATILGSGEDEVLDGDEGAESAAPSATPSQDVTPAPQITPTPRE